MSDNKISPLVQKTVIRHVLMYGSKTWVLRKADQNLPERSEMRMSKWMMGIERIEKIRNEEIRARAGVANISEKIREARLRWLGHVERKTEEDENMEDGSVHRKIGRPKLRWTDAVRKIKRERSKYRRSTRPDSLPEIRKWPKKNFTHKIWHQSITMSQ